MKHNTSDETLWFLSCKATMMHQHQRSFVLKLQNINYLKSRKSILLSSCTFQQRKKKINFNEYSDFWNKILLIELILNLIQIYLQLWWSFVESLCVTFIQVLSSSNQYENFELVSTFLSIILDIREVILLRSHTEPSGNWLEINLLRNHNK